MVFLLFLQFVAWKQPPATRASKWPPFIQTGIGTFIKILLAKTTTTNQLTFFIYMAFRNKMKRTSEHFVLYPQIPNALYEVGCKYGNQVTGGRNWTQHDVYYNNVFDPRLYVNVNKFIVIRSCYWFIDVLLTIYDDDDADDDEYDEDDDDEDDDEIWIIDLNFIIVSDVSTV